MINTDKALFDLLDQDNDTGFSTQDLVKIYNAHHSNQWEAVSLDELMAEIDLLEKQDRKP